MAEQKKKRERELEEGEIESDASTTASKRARTRLPAKVICGYCNEDTHLILCSVIVVGTESLLPYPELLVVCPDCFKGFHDKEQCSSLNMTLFGSCPLDLSKWETPK